MTAIDMPKDVSLQIADISIVTAWSGHLAPFVRQFSLELLMQWRVKCSEQRYAHCPEE
jgi:hypothetical protein